MFKILAKLSVLYSIRLYQRTLSLDHGWLGFLFPDGYCQYHPSCSEYTHQAISRFGLIKGGKLAVWRVIRCNPWSKGGIDEVPEIKKPGGAGPGSAW